ncbi:MAG: hypothetical protein ACKO9Q_12295, partial [Pirellula sp.]
HCVAGLSAAGVDRVGGLEYLRLERCGKALDGSLGVKLVVFGCWMLLSFRMLWRNRPSVHQRFAWKFAIAQTRSGDYPDGFRVGDQDWIRVVRLCSNLGAFVKLVAW